MDARPLTGKAHNAINLPAASITAYEGSVRSGKTFTSLLDWVRFVRHGPAGRLLMTGRTERTIINNLLQPLQELLGAERVRINYGQGRAVILGREILIVGANNEAARTKIQGLTLVGAYVDEASTLPESYFNMLYSRLSVEGSRLWLTSNPEGPAHWLKTKWLDRASLWLTRDGSLVTKTNGIDLHRATFVLDDNPNLPAKYVASLKSAYTGLWYRRYVEAEWVAAEGAIYSMWDPTVHVVPWARLPVMDRLLAVGIDYGTTNASTALMLGLGAGRLWLVDEWRHDPAISRVRLTDAQLSASLRDWLTNDHLPHPTSLRPEWVCVDPAAASFKVQLHYDGVPSLVDADNDVAYGIRTTASLLGSQQLAVADRCTGFITEAPGYAWSDKAAEQGRDEPLKVADHSLDGARYAITTTEPLWRGHLTDLTTT